MSENYDSTYDLAFEVDAVQGEIACLAELLDDSHEEIANLSIDLAETDIALAQLKFPEVQRKIRLLEVLLLQAKREAQRSHSQLESLTGKVLSNSVVNIKAKKPPQEVH